MRKTHKKPILSKQTTSGSCGLASLKNSITSTYNKDIAEEKLIHKGQKIYNKKNIPCKIEKDGIGPWGLSKLIKGFVSKEIDVPFKVFMTANGTIRQLRFFLDMGINPIIHREFHEDGSEEGHYEVVIKMTKRHIHIFNSANGFCNSGLYKMDIRYFSAKWWHWRNERWLMAFYNKDIVLPKDIFKGKYG